METETPNNPEVVAATAVAEAESQEDTRTMAMIFWNIFDNRIQVIPDARLKDDEYEALKDAGFAWWPKHGYFTAVWHLWRENAVLKTLNVTNLDEGYIEVVEEEPDDVARARRFEGYANNAQASADASRARAERISERFYMGQPIILGHHSERGARADQNRMWNATQKAVDESKRAAYWRGRGLNALRRSEEFDTVVFWKKKKIELEKELRKEVREHDNPRFICDFPTPEARAEAVARYRAQASRTIGMMTMRLEFLKGRIEALGGDTTAAAKAEAGEFKFEVGGRFCVIVYGKERWGVIKKVNRTTLSEPGIIPDSTAFDLEVPKSAVVKYISPAEIAAAKAAKEAQRAQADQTSNPITEENPASVQA